MILPRTVALIGMLMYIVLIRRPLTAVAAGLVVVLADSTFTADAYFSLIRCNEAISAGHYLIPYFIVARQRCRRDGK